MDKQFGSEELSGMDESSLQQLLLSAGADPSMLQGMQAPPAESHKVAPVPGFCIKTKDENNEKVFINVCHNESLPKPPPVTDEKLIELVSADQPGDYRVPMSLGEPHAELDNNGRGCNAFDVVVNTSFLLEMQNREMLMSFFITIVLEGIEHKFSTNLSRVGWKILKNRKFVGSLPEQSVRAVSKPRIMELDSNDSGSKPKKPLISEVPDSERSKGAEPPYTIIQEPPTGHPEFLVAEIHLPLVKSSESVDLMLGEDRILLETRSNIYHLDIYLPFNLIQEECGSQFNRQTKIMSLTMPVQPAQ